jgi:hypothetical protein
LDVASVMFDTFSRWDEIQDEVAANHVDREASGANSTAHQFDKDSSFDGDLS